MTQPEQIEMFEGKQMRDAALDKVSTNAGSWFLCAMELVKKFANKSPGRLVTGEDIRLEVTSVIGPPHHHNAWGAVIKFSRVAGRLKRTGGRTSMKDPRSHARDTPIYELVKERLA